MTRSKNDEIKRYIETNENENMAYQDLWDTIKAVIKEKFTLFQAYLRKQEKF